ncbi:hypothetical protein JJJ17_19575 [Paracoccus caeni]|uniref:Uncharacterized protein n=1 Tax=Paracoccus caeni TaxID=657651 RepID=A0A934W274_9RHOB|nr:hypothetical protein [Paracoccus caeni]MBK4218133.1 hypothetical protein [Paracoccus caeni]
MIIVVLFLIVLGSLTAALAAYIHDFSWGFIAISYVAGGWGGLLTGLPALFFLRWRRQRRMMRESGQPDPQPSRR